MEAAHYKVKKFKRILKKSTLLKICFLNGYKFRATSI